MHSITDRQVIHLQPLGSRDHFPASHPEPAIQALGPCPRAYKRRYGTLADAEEELHRLEGSGPVRAYRCGTCGSWHLTSREGGS